MALGLLLHTASALSEPPQQVSHLSITYHDHPAARSKAPRYQTVPRHVHLIASLTCAALTPFSSHAIYMNSLQSRSRPEHGGFRAPGSLQQIIQGHIHGACTAGRLMAVLVLHMLPKRVVVWGGPRAHRAVHHACIMACAGVGQQSLRVLASKVQG